MKLKFLIPFIMLLAILPACSPEVVTETVYVSDESFGAAEPASAPAESRLSFSVDQATSFDGDEGGDFDDSFESEANLSEEQERPRQERLIIRTAELSLIIENTDEAINVITELVESNDGWVVSSNVYEYSDVKQGSITVRVPSTGFNSALLAMKDIALEVTNESISGQDVTEEFVDLSLRLENLEATADRVRAFLDDATEVEDALAVNRELSRLEGEIEQIKGRREFLSQSAQFSTITINLIPDELTQPIEIGGWQPRGIAKEAIETLVEALQGLGGFVIWFFIFLLPMGLLYGVPLYFVGRFVYRWRLRRREQRIAETIAEE
ncbi:MAG: DUF4349 domain-containing protein [Chloroflexota bacterium]